MSKTNNIELIECRQPVHSFVQHHMSRGPVSRPKMTCDNHPCTPAMRFLPCLISTDTHRHQHTCNVALHPDRRHMRQPSMHASTDAHPHRTCNVAVSRQQTTCDNPSIHVSTDTYTHTCNMTRITTEASHAISSMPVPTDSPHQLHTTHTTHPYHVDRSQHVTSHPCSSHRYTFIHALDINLHTKSNPNNM